MANRLVRESSPYLQQHASNPVEWFPWCNEAFRRAVERDVPLLVSIGYSACHWCHVMERESFQNDEIARLMNSNFINIKVDREERPDIDSIYMSAVLSMTGHGGWPLTVFIDHNRNAFYGGTYYPPERRGGSPGFPEVLEAVSQAYKNKRVDLEENGAHIMAHIGTHPQASMPRNIPDLTKIDYAYRKLESEFDWNWGGFGNPTKFPQPLTYEFLLRYHEIRPESRALEMTELTLRKIASGGIYDHVGGGVHRYSTDREWVTPHFEKMLYDNALISRLFTHVYQVTQNLLYKEMANDILAYVRAEMLSDKGLFYASQDADSEGEEGRYYTWHLSELKQFTDEVEMSLLTEKLNVSPEGNFDGGNILHFKAKDFDGGILFRDKTARKLRKKLAARRANRPPPFKDETAITFWNCLIVTSLCENYMVTGHLELLETAKQNMNIYLDAFGFQRGLPRSIRRGQMVGEGYLEDHAAFINALISLHEATLDLKWLREALVRSDEMINNFWDAAAGRFYDVSTQGNLPVRPLDYYDGVTPSGLSSAIEALNKLSYISDDQRYHDIVISQQDKFFGIAVENPLSFSNWLCVMLDRLTEGVEIAIVSREINSSSAMALRDVLFRNFIPNRALVGDTHYHDIENKNSGGLLSPLLYGRRPGDDGAAVYWCENYSCQRPVFTPGDIQDLLDKRRIKLIGGGPR